MKKSRITISIILILTLVFGMAQTSFASAKIIDVSSHIQNTAKYILNTVKEPEIATIGGEWTIIGLARSGYDVPQSYYDNYYNRVVTQLKNSNGELSKTKYTEYSRLILSLTSIGKDVTNVGGYNLLEKLSDFNNVKKQGINGSIFGLIAFDSHNYEIPKLSGVTKQNTRQIMIDEILGKEITDAKGVRGGFALTGNVPDPDVTGMALQALWKYKDQPLVKAAIDRAIKVLDGLQGSNGNFTGWTGDNIESLCQVIIGKTALGIDASNNMEATLGFGASNGGFKHILTDEVNQMGTEQGFLAMVAYNRQMKGQAPLYDMNDVKLNSSESGQGTPTPNQINVTLNGKYLTFGQPPVNVNGRVLVPMRAIFEAMGAKVNWDGATKKVTGLLDNITVELTVGSKNASVNGTNKVLDVPATIVNSTTMVPLRFVAESLNAKVDYNVTTKTVVIEK